MRHIYEKPQKGNPHQLTVNQHIFPVVSIARFAISNGAVSLYDKVRRKTRQAWPRDPIFSTKRAWDHRSESGYMKSIEDQFQDLVDKIIYGSVAEIGDTEKSVIDHFFALWYMRSRHKYLAVSNVQMNGSVGASLTQDQEEHLEKNWVAFARAGGKFPARMVNGLELQVRIDGYVRDLADKKWSIIHAQEGEFIVPDIPSHDIIPLTPTVCLTPHPTGGTIVRSNVAEINRAVITASSEYFFARDFSKCPGYTKL